MAKKNKNNDMWNKSADSDVRPDALQDMIELADLPEADSEVDTVEDWNAALAQDTADCTAQPPEQAAADGDLADRADAALRGWLRSMPGRFSALRQRLVQFWYLLGSVFYEIGYYLEYGLVKFGRSFKRGARVAAKGLWKGLVWALKTVLWLPIAILKLLAKPFYHVYHGIKSVCEIWYTRDPDRLGETWKATFRYIGGGIVRNAHLIPDILGWILPIAAAGVFVFTVRTVMDYQYVLQVSYGDKVLGYVTSDSVVEAAQRDVQARIVYTEDDSAEEWELVPSYALTVNEGVTVMNADQVADAILKNSGKEIIEATGLYIGGVFYGATTEGDRLAAELEAMKAPYATGAEGEYISFVVEPELVEGIYLQSSMVDFEDLNTLIHSQVAGEVRYTVVNGDNPSGIAQRHGLTTNELVNMNPQQDILKSLHPGDSLVVSQAVSFLQVKVTYRRAELEEVPYDVKRTTTADLNFGFTKTQVKGVKGVNECTYDYVYVDGVLQSKTLVSVTVISAPVTEEILIGTTVRPGQTFVPDSGGYIWPIPGFRSISRGFTGLYKHNGIDITGSVGTPIYAAKGGVVTKAVYGTRGYGIYVVVDHGDGTSTLYGHCSGLAVQQGAIVNQGDLIAYLGNTGNSTGPHCHFELRINGVQVNPAPYVGLG